MVFAISRQTMAIKVMPSIITNCSASIGGIGAAVILARLDLKSGLF
jgi:hypothetical protein